jgi:hypothetical protein
MPEAELFLLFVRPLNGAAIRYMIGGSVAAIFYGEPRLTHDVDFVVSLESDDVQRFIALSNATKPILSPLRITEGVGKGSPVGFGPG